MKTLRFITSALIFTVLIIITGCSEEIMSPVSNSNESDNVTFSNENINDPKIFHDMVRLEPHQILTYDSQNTIFKSFNSISVLNCGEAKNSIEISGRIEDAIILLNCNSSGFFAYSITIENTTSHMVDLDIYLTGILKKYTDPVGRTRNIF